MLSKSIRQAASNNSAIRAMFNLGKELSAQYGAENVYDYSLGNPLSPVPASFTKALTDLLAEEKDTQLHGYMDNAGYPAVRAALADNLNRRFGTRFTQEELIMTVGAAGALNVVFKTLLDEGDEVLAFAPFFSEYKNYARNYGGSIVPVQPDAATFQPDFADLEAKVTPHVKAVLVNNPVNPTGVLYTAETVTRIADILRKKQKEYGHEIYLVSDEPYRELVYDGKTVPFLTEYYDNTFVTYSFSKSMSIPGERIGYIAVSPTMADKAAVITSLTVANRILGFVNAPSLLQKAVARCVDTPTDLAFYDRNRQLLYNGLTELGFHCIYPDGAFYLFMQSPIADSDAFVKLATEKYHILMVSCTGFSYPGFVRLAYCVRPEMIERSLSAFAGLAAEFGLSGK